MNARNTVPGSLFIKEKLNLKDAQNVVLAICYARIKSDIFLITDDLHTKEYPIIAIERNSDIHIHNV